MEGIKMGELFELFELVKLLSFVSNPMLFWLVVGLFIGWNVPQPTYAKMVQDKVVKLAKMLVTKFKGMKS